MNLAQAGVLLHKVTAQYSLLGFCGIAMYSSVRGGSNKSIGDRLLTARARG